MRRVCAITLLAGLAACTHYQPLAWNGRGSWLQAKIASSRAVDAAPAVVAAAGRRQAVAGPTLYRVRPGETLATIAARQGLPQATLARANGLAAAPALRSGQFLRIPAAGQTAAPAAGRPTPPPTSARPMPAPLPPAVIAVAERAPDGLAATVPPVLSPAAAAATHQAASRVPPALAGPGFLWPAEGELASGFGEKPNGARNNGINIAADAGTPVWAAENGIVVYAGSGIPGYGNMLLISHANGFMTAYAHNRDLLVRVGDVVARGQEIATVGSTGRIGTPQLHFEIRAGKKPLDPMLHLGDSPTRVAARAG